MRVRDNKLGSIQRFFRQELAGIYSDGEIEALFNAASAHYLGWNRQEITRRLQENINQSELLLLYDCAKALARQEPLQYILGVAWFFDMELSVDRNVLIPRPETEELVDLALRRFSARAASVLDIGTGSGCIALAIKNKRQDYVVEGCDVSSGALKVAGSNAKQLDLAVRFFECDILKSAPGSEYDLIISNPPYIEPREADEMSVNVLAHEPHSALFTPPGDALIFYKKIADFCAKGLRSGGMLFFELNPMTAEQVVQYVNATKYFADIKLENDMSGKKRFLHATKK